MLVLANRLIELLVIQHNHTALNLCPSFRLDTALLRDELCERLEITTTIVVYRFLALAIEPFQRWKALDAKPATKFLVCVGVDFGDADLVLDGGEVCGEFFPDGGEVLAVCEELC